MEKERQNPKLIESSGAAITSWTGGTESIGWDHQSSGTFGKDPEILGTQARRGAIVWLLLMLQELSRGAASSWERERAGPGTAEGCD